MKSIYWYKLTREKVSWNCKNYQLHCKQAISIYPSITTKNYITTTASTPSKKKSPIQNVHKNKSQNQQIEEHNPTFGIRSGLGKRRFWALSIWRWVNNMFFSFNRIYQSLWRSSQDFRRNSEAFQPLPKCEIFDS